MEKETFYDLFLFLIYYYYYMYLFIVVFTGERRLIETVAVSQLKGLRLGIDGSYWLRKIMLKEPALAAIGGAPIALQHCIEKELESFK